MHRAQGATVDTAQRLRRRRRPRTRYVKTSRARGHTHVYVTADDLDQAVDDLRREWAHETRQRWVTDTHQPGPALDDSRQYQPTPLQQAARRLQLDAERWAVNALLPLDVTDQLQLARQRVAHLASDLEGLHVGRYRYDEHISNAGHERNFVRHELYLAQRDLDQPTPRGRRGRAEHAACVERIQRAERRVELAEQKWARLSAPVESRLREELADARAVVGDLSRTQQQRLDWLYEHRRPDGVAPQRQRPHTASKITPSAVE